MGKVSHAWSQQALHCCWDAASTDPSSRAMKHCGFSVRLQCFFFYHLRGRLKRLAASNGWAQHRGIAADEVTLWCICFWKSRQNTNFTWEQLIPLERNQTTCIPFWVATTNALPILQRCGQNSSANIFQPLANVFITLLLKDKIVSRKVFKCV